MKRKILSLILVFAMTVSLLTVGTGAVEPTYGDTAGHWAESSIERWSAYGIIQGSNGQFDPNGQLTCAQLATILAKLLKLPAAKDAGFTDNTADAWYYDAINRCAAAGILNGNGDGTVTPEAPITRERAMVMLARALGIEPIRKPDLTKYTDAAQVSAYAQGYVAALIEAGIVGGVTADELAPQDNINRASTVTILDRAIGTYADKAGATVKADGKGIVLVVAENVKITGAPEGTKIVVADGATGLTVNGKSVSDDQTYIVPKTTSSGSSSGGYSHTHSYDATTHKCSCGEFAPDVVATIGDTNGYLTLEAAVAAATNGATVKLVKGALLDADISISSKITLDLNGNTIETNGKKISVAGTGDLTVTGNGIVNNQVDADKAGGTTNRYTMLSVEEGGKLTIENGTFTTKAAQIVYTYGSTTIRGGTFKNTSTNTSEETDEALNSGALIVVCGTHASLTMTDGTVTTESQYLYGVFVRDGGNAIFGDEETENGPSIHTHRYAAIGENNTMATANITIYGGEYTVSTVPASDAWKPFCATIYASASGEINIHGGTFTGYYAISDRYEKVEQTVTITGGTFNGAEADLYVTSDSGKGTTANRIIAIAGGTFDHNPDATYIATGYEAKDNNGTWTVSEKTNVTLVAQVGVNKYESLAEAFTAAKSGDTVKLVGNISTDARIEVTGDKNITIDLAEKTITSKADVAIVNNGTGKLTITGNGTVDTSSSTNGENIAIWARTGSIDIENGTFINKSNKEATVYAGTSADVSTPVIIIKGGTFENKATGPYEYKNSLKPLTLNVENSKPVTSIVITGGTFVGQNPGDGDDNKGGTFLAEGCITLVNNDTFTVSNTDEIPVTTATVQDYLDGKYGSINGKTLVLGGDNYGKIEFGRATAYAGSNTEYYLSGTKSTPDAIKQDIADHPNGGAGNRVYVRNMSGVTLKAAEGAAVTINGLVAFGGQVNSTKWYSRDFVADRVAENNNTSYYINQKWNNITFEGLTFTGGVNIEAYQGNTRIDNVNFNGCKFNVSDTETNQTNCIRLNVDGNQAKADNLVVASCEFTDGYTAVLTDGMPNVTVRASTFSGLTKHAINPMMNWNGAPGYEEITVTRNTFKNMSSETEDNKPAGTILRMGEVGAGAVFTIQNNTATEGITLANSIKVTSLADDGITYNISGNNWGSLTASDPKLNG
mgnify:CR=1 FL=1